MRYRQPDKSQTDKYVHELAERCAADHDVVLFLAYTGLRWGELAALRVGDVDFARRRINVNQAVTEVGRDLVYGTPKNHSRRSVPYPAFIEPSLRQQAEGREDARLLITAPAGGALRNRNWRRRNFERAVQELVHAHPELALFSRRMTSDTRQPAWPHRQARTSRPCTACSDTSPPQ